MSNQSMTVEGQGKPVSTLIQNSEESSLMRPDPFDDDVVLSQPKLQIMMTDSEEVISKEKSKSVEDSLTCLLCINACCEFLSQCWYLVFCCCDNGCGECLGGCCECAECCGECANCCSGGV